MDDEYRDKILSLVVDEAVQKDKDKGMIIDNPSGYHRYKMERARHQAKEDPAWLLRQRDRLLGAVTHPLGFNTCERCGPRTCTRHDGTEFTITYEDAARLHPRIAKELEADDEF